MHHVLRIVLHQSVKFWKIIMESNMGWCQRFMLQLQNKRLWTAVPRKTGEPDVRHFGLCRGWSGIFRFYRRFTCIDLWCKAGNSSEFPLFQGHLFLWQWVGIYKSDIPADRAYGQDRSQSLIIKMTTGACKIWFWCNTFDFISYTSVRDIWIRYYDYEPDKMRTEKSRQSFCCPQKIRKNLKNKNFSENSKKHLPNNRVYDILNLGRVKSTMTNKYTAPWSSG